MMKTTVCICACFLAVTSGFAPQVGLRPATQLGAYEGNGVSKKNSPDKASRFRALDNEGSQTAAKAFVEPSAPKKSSGGGNFFSNLFGGGADKAAEAVDAAASKVQGATASVTKEAGRTVRNPRDKASRFRVDQDRQEGPTAARAFRQPSANRGSPSASSQSWTIPSKFDAQLGAQKSKELKQRADKYMRGAISSTDMARTLTQAGLGELAPEIIGTMPAGEKRAALFKLYKQF